MKLFCRKGDLIRLLVPTISAWQGIGIAADKVYDDGDPDTVVPFFKQDQPLDDQVVPLETAPEMMRGHELERLAQRQHTRSELLTIAAELEGAQ